MAEKLPQSITLNGKLYFEIDPNKTEHDSLDIVELNGKYYELAKAKKEEPSFTLVFNKDVYLKNNSQDDKVLTRTDKNHVYIDIYKILVDKLGEKGARGALKAFQGVSYESEDTGSYKFVFDGNDFDSIRLELENLVSATFTNQKQANGFLDITNRILNRRFNSFYDNFFLLP